MSEPGEVYAPRHGDLVGRTQTIRLPETWDPEDWGGWQYMLGAYTKEGDEFNLFYRPPDESWTVALFLERGKPILLNPVIVAVNEAAHWKYWPDCLEDLQSLLSQVASYGYAREFDDGWDLRATVTAAEARAAIAADDALRPIYYDDKDWRFTETTDVVPILRVGSGGLPPRMTPASFATNVPMDAQRPAPRRQQPDSARDPSARSAASTSQARQRPGTAGARHRAATPRPGEGRTR
ncbi:hypothetical protein [Amycolatopsis sp. VC5-11]|uniref:hypothetical protein n=1 Tax=Amycolatopsis sp. VC5-11 TaxID=3120156 RepID=UPI00300BB5F5